MQVKLSCLQGMVLGLRALVAAGAESVMVLYTSRQAIFRPQRSSTGVLINTSELEQYLAQVQLQGRDFEGLHIVCPHQHFCYICMQ